MSSEAEIIALAETLRNVIADENARVGWKEYGEHIRRGGADDLAARVSMEIARRSYLLGRADGYCIATGRDIVSDENPF